LVEYLVIDKYVENHDWNFDWIFIFKWKNIEFGIRYTCSL